MGYIYDSEGNPYHTSTRVAGTWGKCHHCHSFGMVYQHRMIWPRKLFAPAKNKICSKCLIDHKIATELV